MLDSDDFFHKPTDPPFREQYSGEERNRLILDQLAPDTSWILSGSISTWGITEVRFSHAMLLNPGVSLRLKRLKIRESERFGQRIESGGDMYDDHIEFMNWARSYESGELEGRNLRIERKFLGSYCNVVLEIEEERSLEALKTWIISRLRE